MPLHYADGSLARGPWQLEMTQERAGWSWSSLRVLALGVGERCEFESGDEELVILSLSGSCRVESDGVTFDVRGRPSVFHGASDFVYAPRDSTLTVSSSSGGRFAVGGAKTTRPGVMRYQPVENVPVEYRGAGQCSRRVMNTCTTDSFEAERIILCEVVTPAGNWSSYPPHKHDEDRPGESVLEEIYYFEVNDDGRGAGMGYQQVYGTPERPIELLAQVGQGDVVLIPHGWHGPTMAAPGYDLYFLNVMAGPGERAWRICDDPAHAWIRDTWTDQVIDPRVFLAN